MHRSIAAVEAYCHFLRLFLKFIEMFPELRLLIDKKVEAIIKCKNKGIWEAVNKKNLGDMGEFLIILGLSKYSI